MSEAHFSRSPQGEGEPYERERGLRAPQWEELPEHRPHSALLVAGAFVALVAMVGALLFAALRPAGPTGSVGNEGEATTPAPPAAGQAAPPAPESAAEQAAAPEVPESHAAGADTGESAVIEAQPAGQNLAAGASVSGDPELDADLAALSPYFYGEGDEALRQAYEYVAANYEYTHQEEYPEGGFETWGIPFAKEMYANGAGNCYRFSSLFCWIARSLGYDATVVQGMVPLSSGLAVHGWCEVHRDGQSFVCDPDLHKFLPDIDLFMVTYDDSRLAYYHMDGVTVHTNAEG